MRTLDTSPEKLYHRRTQPKKKFGRDQVDKNGSTRMRSIRMPSEYLKLKQRELIVPLQSLPTPHCMYGGVKGKNNIANAKRHESGNFFLTVDLRSFFANIGRNRIYKTLVERGFTHTEAYKITRLSTLDGVLPQGAPTSTAIANLVFSATASLLDQFCIPYGITFTVFVDDLNFSSKSDFEKHVPEILAIIKDNQFFINHRKVHYRRGCCEITGLIVKNKKLHLEKKMSQNLHVPGVNAYAKLVNTYNNLQANLR
nr:reverse transcriptase family protein [uncultured Mucilaginibacter sp.]